MTAAELAAARMAARTADEILTAEARIAWAKMPEHDGGECPADRIPAPVDLFRWLPECPPSAWDEVTAAELAHGPGAVAWASGLSEIVPIVRLPEPMAAHLVDRSLVECSRQWRSMPEPLPRHPVAPLVDAWQRRAPNVGAGTVTVTRNDVVGAGMTRRAALVSTLRRVHWRTDEGGAEPLVTGAVVDGEPMAAPRPDTADLFPVRKRRPRRRFQPGEQCTLALPVVPPIPHDLRLIALADLAGDPILQGDVLALLGFAWAADRPLVVTEREGAAMLARARDGRPRAVQVQHDVPRFWQTAYALRALVAWEPGPRGEPGGGYRWADLATVEVPSVQPVDRVTIGPPTWARPLAGKWTLTAEASAASIARAVSGQHGLAGRIVTGIEYRLAAGWTRAPPAPWPRTCAPLDVARRAPARWWSSIGVPACACRVTGGTRPTRQRTRRPASGLSAPSRCCVGAATLSATCEPRRPPVTRWRSSAGSRRRAGGPVA